MTDAVTDPIDRLAVLAAALPGAAVRRRRIAAPLATVWPVVADLEHSSPLYEPGVAELRIVARDGEFLRIRVRDTSGRTDLMDARLRTGWCLMQSAAIVIAFAARDLGDATLLAHLEQRRTGTVDHRAALAKIDGELRTIDRLATGR